MNSRQTVELAVLASANSAHVIESAAPLPEHVLRNYWKYSRRMIHRWIRALRCVLEEKQFSGAATLPKVPQETSEVVRRGAVLREVFASEILTRVWSAVLTAKDRRCRSTQSEPLARSVLIDQMEARRWALEVMVRGIGLSAEEMLKTDQFRRRSERWTDLLLGHLVTRYDLRDFCFDEMRARDFAHQQLEQQLSRPNSQIWQLVLAGVRLSFPQSPAAFSDLATDSMQVHRAILSAFPPDAFEENGPFRSIRQARLSRIGPWSDGPVDEPVVNIPSTNVATPVAAAPSGSQSISFAKLRRRFGGRTEQ